MYIVHNFITNVKYVLICLNLYMYNIICYSLKLVFLKFKQKTLYIVYSIQYSLIQSKYLHATTSPSVIGWHRNIYWLVWVYVCMCVCFHTCFAAHLEGAWHSRSHCVSGTKHQWTPLPVSFLWLLWERKYRCLLYGRVGVSYRQIFDLIPLICCLN